MKEQIDALNASIQEMNGLIKTFQRDPMREAFFKHSMDAKVLGYNESVEILDQSDAFNPQTITDKLNAADLIISGDFKFSFPPREIRIVSKAVLTTGNTTTQTSIGIAFSNDGRSFTKTIHVPSIQFLNTAALTYYSESYNLCALWVRIFIVTPSATPVYPATFFNGGRGAMEYVGRSASLTLCALK